MKIVIAGAGIGGLAAAEQLGRMGFHVTVYEQAESLDAMRYDWHDDVNPDVFRELALEIPAEHFPKKSWTFVSPFAAVTREFRQDESHPDFSIERRPLNRVLYERAVKVAEVVFGSKVTAPLLSPGRVCGLVVNGQRVYADLVVDSLGVDSPCARDSHSPLKSRITGPMRSLPSIAPSTGKTKAPLHPNTPTRFISSTWGKAASPGLSRITTPSWSTC